MGKRWYRQPHWWFNTRLEHTPARSLGHMFLYLPACRASHLLIASAPSWQIDIALEYSVRQHRIVHLCKGNEGWSGSKQVI